ncbi:hypothetical protein IT157_08135, partial [bacterium]|nr:hypothetical protein [bacterium]
MKLKTILFLGCLLLVSAMAHAQGFAVGMFYDPTVTPLTNQCGSGDILPDGTTVEIFWDDNSDGPDPTDALLPLDHPSQPNFNTFPLNTGAFGLPGGVILDPVFSCAVAGPVPPRFWIRICVPDSARHYHSRVWTVQPGLNPDIVFTLITNLADSATVTNAIWCMDEGCGGCLAPPPVSGLIASENRCDGINLTWNSYTGQPLVTELRVYRDAVTGTPLATLAPTATSYLDTGAPTGTSTYYLVAHKVCSPADGDTANSSNVSASGIRVAAPATPTIVGATENLCGEVTISWTNAASLGSTDTMRITRNGVVIHQLDPNGAGQAQNYTWDSGDAGRYGFRVEGWNAACGAGTPSAVDTGEAKQAPVQVTGVDATDGQCTVNVTWNAISGATHYRVYRNTALIQTVTAPTTNYVDTPPLIDTPYSYTVDARNLNNPNGCQDGPISASASGSRIGPPNPPSGVVASDTICTHVRVTWVDNSNNETGFIVRRGAANLDTVGAGVVTFNDSTGLAGTTYSYSVLSLNDCGPSASSNTDNGVKLAALGQVTGVGATDNLPDRVTVTWNNIANETGYRIFRNGSSLNTVLADITTYHDMTAVPGVVYGYSVAAMNQCGDGTVSVVDSGRVFATIDPPGNVQASTSLPTHVALTWDNVDDETGYYVRRDDMQALLTIDTLATLPPNSTSYNDSSGNPGQWYLYTIISFNATSSAVSQPDSGRKLGVPAAPVLTQTLIHCDTVFYSWTSDAETDTVVFFLDGVEVATSLAQSGDRYQILPDAAAHTIQAKGANEAGRSAFSNTLNVATDTGPDAPFNVVGSSTDCETVAIGWASPDGADSIRIYRDDVFVGVVVGASEDFTDIVGYGPATYSYYLIAENECGDSPNSDTIQVSVGEPPSIPTDVTASDSLCDGVSVSWSASTGDVDGYDIYRDDVLVGSVAGDVLQYTDQPLDNVDHTYTVVAVSTECDDSAPSAGYTGHEVAAAEVPTGLAQIQPERCD